MPSEVNFYNIIIRSGKYTPRSHYKKVNLLAWIENNNNKKP